MSTRTKTTGFCSYHSRSSLSMHGSQTRLKNHHSLQTLGRTQICSYQDEKINWHKLPSNGSKRWNKFTKAFCRCNVSQRITRTQNEKQCLSLRRGIKCIFIQLISRQRGLARNSTMLKSDRFSLRNKRNQSTINSNFSRTPKYTRYSTYHYWN